MRALVVSDVHGNIAALEAVLAVPHDALISLGDLVGYGPAPAACVAVIRDSATIAVQGNHDRAFGLGMPSGASARFQWIALATQCIGDAQLDDADREFLGGQPRWAFSQLGGERFMFVHATPRNPLYEYLGPDAAAWADRVRDVTADVIAVGHTHLQFRLNVGGRTVVNPGSTGQPKDGDPGAAYAIIEDGAVSLHRIAYDVEATVSALERSPAPAEAVKALTQLLRTGRVPDDLPEREAAAARAS